MSFSFRDKPRLSERIRGKSGDELFNELKEHFDKDRKMFFDTSPKWGPGSTSGSFPRTGFPFDDDMMSRSRQDIRSHLDDLAARHPEFAEHLRCPPWGGEVGSSQNRGQPKESDCDDDARSQASGVSSSSSEPHGPEVVDAQGPLPQYGLRNTVDLGQKQQEAYQDEKQGRGQRSMSAPPDNRSQQPEQQRYVSRVEIPVNAAGVTSCPSADGLGKPPVAPKQQPMQQNQSTPTKQPGNVRHIPIFVEGRDEPILPKNVAPDYVEQVFPPRTAQPEMEHIFSPRQPSQPPHTFARPSQFFPQQAYTQQPAPVSPKQQRHVKPQQATPIKVQHTSARSPKVPPKSPSKQGEQTIPIKVQHTTTTQQQGKPPSKPPEPAANDPISRVKLVQKDVEQLRSQVQQYSGSSRKDKEYIYLDEMLTRNLLKLDDIDTEGKENVRQARKEVIKKIQQCISELEAKVPVPEEASCSEEQEPMEEVSMGETEQNLCQENSKAENLDTASDEMEVTTVENVAAHKGMQDTSAPHISETETQSGQVEANEDSKNKPIEEVNQKKEAESQEEVEGEKTGISKEDTVGALTVHSEQKDIPMEHVEGKETSFTEEIAIPMENKEGAGDVGATTEGREQEAIPMEIEHQGMSSSELKKEEYKQSNESSTGTLEQQAQEIPANSPIQPCDKDVKSS